MKEIGAFRIYYDERRQSHQAKSGSIYHTQSRT